MKQEFFQEIGKCSPHKYEMKEQVTTERIYRNVKKRIETAQQKKKKNRIMFLTGLLATTAAVFCLFYTQNAMLDQKQNINANSEITATDSSKHESAVLVKFCMYEATKEGQVVTANYKKDMRETELKIDSKTILGTYDLLTSVIPGYPIIVSSGTNNTEKKNISIKVSAGKLLQWNQDTGDIKTIGKSGKFTSQENIFWSPLEDEKLTDSVQIVATYSIEGEKDKTIEIEITKKDSTYVAKRIK